MGDDYRELWFFLSHAVSLELQCHVARLELPTVPPLRSERLRKGRDGGSNSSGDGSSSATPGNLAAAASMAAAAVGSTANGDAEWGAAIEALKRQEEFVVTLQLVSNGELMHEVPLSTRTPSRYDAQRNAILWEDLISFPIRYRDMARDSRLVATVRDVAESIVGRAALCLFDAHGALKTGRQKLNIELLGVTVPANNYRKDQSAGNGAGHGPAGSGNGTGGGAGGGGGGGADSQGGSSSGGSRAAAAPCCDSDVYQREFAAYDYAFKLEKAQEEYELDREVGRATGASWLDRVSLPRVEELVSGMQRPEEAKKLQAHCSDGEERMRRAAFLVVDLPAFAHPVIFEQKPYITAAPAPGPGLAAAPASATAAAAAAAAAAAGAPPADVAAAAGGAFGGPMDGMDPAALNGRAFQVVADWELEEDNPVENKYRKLAHRLLRGLADPELRPNKEEREALDRVINSHLLGDHLRPEEKDLLWKFRHCLTDDRKALTKLLLSVDWAVDSEVAQVADLLKQWRERAPIDVSDALKLLGRERAFQTQMVRSFAVDTLRQASDDELTAYMLQLVQALRYEPGASETGPAMDPAENGSPAADGLMASPGSSAVTLAAGGGSGGSSGLAAAAAAAAAISAAAADDAAGAAAWEALVSPLARFLIERAAGSLELANFLYWYLRVGLEDATHSAMYTRVWAAFRAALQRTRCSSGFGAPEPGGHGEAVVSMWSLLQAQEAYVAGIAEAQRTARDEKGRKAQKEELLRKLLEAPSLRRVGGGSPTAAATAAANSSAAAVNSSAAGIACIPLPLDPHIRVTGLQPSSAFMFRSALYPCVVEFRIFKQGEGAAAEEKATKGASRNGDAAAAREPGYEHVAPYDAADHLAAAATAAAGAAAATATAAAAAMAAAEEKKSNGGSYRVIVKSGDDLRQDQLIIQMVSLMDKLLKRVNLDLKLKPYRILATGPRDGLVEFVPDSLPVSAVLTKYSNSILEFLRQNNPDPAGPYGVRAEAISTFVRSSAGYCVITFILGIGDRHLDNLMLLPAGNLFHIDFGYIFGRDPKPMAPPFRLTREMVEAMGGVGSPHYAQFCTYCCQAYNWLRKSANLILNLLSLMADAGIEGVDAGAGGLTTVEDRFRLDLTDEQAEHFFLRLINDSLRALAPRVLEVMHQIAVARR